MLALVGGRLIDGTGRDPVEDAVILINSQVIEEVGRQGMVGLPEECEAIEIRGKTVLPGLMDLHVHLTWGTSDIGWWPAGLCPPVLERPLTLVGIKGFARARRALEMGFTTLRDVGDVGYLAVALRDAINEGVVEGPRIVASGQYLNTTAGHGNSLPFWLTRNDITVNVADGVDGVLAAVRRQIKMKTDWVKFCATGDNETPWLKQQFNDDEMRALVGEAHDKGRLVCAHCMMAQGLTSAVRAGVDSIEHGLGLTEESIDLMVQKGTYLVPTLYAASAAIERGVEFGIPPSLIDEFKPLFEIWLKGFEMALEAGVKIALGTDCGMPQCPHGTNASELELLVRYGMRPMEAIVAATRISATALRMEDRLGTIEPGKLADLVVVDGNPLEEIKILQDKDKIALVMKEGSVYANRL